MLSREFSSNALCRRHYFEAPARQKPVFRKIPCKIPCYQGICIGDGFESDWLVSQLLIKRSSYLATVSGLFAISF
jgi:hypothetical protein